MQRRICAILTLVLAALASATAHAQPKSEWEIKQEALDWKENAVALPAYPKAENLVEFEANAAGRGFRFFIDSQSVLATGDGTVRYTMVARSSSGTDNVTFDGLRCKTGTHKVFATGRAGGTWVRVPNSEWKELLYRNASRQHHVLMNDFFCPSGVPIMSREEGLAALRAGIHPHAVSYQPGVGRR